jgi:hypothetical protein
MLCCIYNEKNNKVRDDKMEDTLLSNSQVEDVVKNILRKHCYLKEVNSRFESEIYVDYRDCVPEREIKKISQSENKMEAFYDFINETELSCTDYEEDYLLKEIERNWNEDEHGEYSDYSDIILEFIRENVDFNFPYDHFLNQDIKVNLLLDTGDGNYDYTLNNFSSYNAGKDEGISEESSILWLVQQQGYTKEQLLQAVIGEFNGSKFLKSISTECANVTTHMNALTFFVSMTLKEFIGLEDNGYDNLVLGANSNCGLYDPWSGAGSCLEITLEKDVVIPAKFIQAHVDGCRGYGVDEIYGMNSGFWKDSIKKINI